MAASRYIACTIPVSATVQNTGISCKPGFDPVELFMDPAIKIPPLAIGWRLAKKALGFRTLMDVIPLDASLVKGSHGRITDKPEDGPLIISSEGELLPEGGIAGTDVKRIVLDHLFN